MNRTIPRQFIKPSFLLLVSAASLLFSACQPSQQSTVDDDVLQVTVSILPQAYFVERIGGELVAVNVMVGPGEEAHTYEPTPGQMKALAESRIFFSIGVEYEQTWIPRFADINPAMLFVDSAAGIERIPVGDAQAQDETETDNHTYNEGLDPHVWLSPDNGKIIAENVLLALIAVSPDHEEVLQANYDALIADIDSLDQRIEAALSGVEQRTFMVFHPAWGYFAEKYNLEQLPVQVEGQDPSVSEMAELIEIAREKDIWVIFIQPTFNASDAQAIAAEIGAEVAVVDPLARDWLTNLEAVAEAFAAALKE